MIAQSVRPRDSDGMTIAERRAKANALQKPFRLARAAAKQQAWKGDGCAVRAPPLPSRGAYWGRLSAHRGRAGPRGARGAPRPRAAAPDNLVWPPRRPPRPRRPCCSPHPWPSLSLPLPPSAPPIQPTPPAPPPAPRLPPTPQLADAALRAASGRHQTARYHPGGQGASP